LPKLFFFLPAIIFSSQALALEKCVDAGGKISYVDQCPAGTTRAPSMTDEPLVPKPRPGTAIIKPMIEPLPAPGTSSSPPGVTVVPLPAPAPTPAPAAASAPVVPAVPADVQLAYYDVEGTDYASLANAVNARESGHALSSWKLSYEYLPRREKGVCAVGPITTKLELAMTLPRWSPPPGTPQDLVARWERYVNALAANQNRRLERARELERALKPALAAVPPAADCAVLDAAVSERYEALEQESKARDTEAADAEKVVFE
jgi:predicted secreted Zn-dependent protease